MSWGGNKEIQKAPFFLVKINKTDISSGCSKSNESLAKGTAGYSSNLPGSGITDRNGLDGTRGPGRVVYNNLLANAQQKPSSRMWVKSRRGDTLPS